MTFYEFAKRLTRPILGPISSSRLEALLRRPLRWWYRGRQYHCPCCRARLRMFVEGGEICPACGSGRRHRLQWLYLDRVLDFFSQPRRVLDVAPLRYFEHVRRAMENLLYTSLDLSMPWVMIAGDITAIPFHDHAFEVILCSHVLEHVPDDRAAMGELRRVLSPGGLLLIQVPVAGGATLEDPGITAPADRCRLFGQEDHVRSYGSDIAQRLVAAGLEVDAIPYARQFTPTQQSRFALDRDEILYACTTS